MPEVVAALDEHHDWLTSSGELARRRARRARAEIEALAVAALRSRWERVGGTELDDLAAAVVAGTTDPYAAADLIVRSGD